MKTLRKDGHRSASPFPFQHGKRWIVDEKCSCGEMRSKHSDTLGWGHGECKATRCAKFTWVSFVWAPTEGKL